MYIFALCFPPVSFIFEKDFCYILLFLLFLFSWRVAALSWSIKHVCIHTRGAPLHADFADSRNKFRGPSVKEVGVNFLPPQFHTEAINWALSQEQNKAALTRQYTCSCSIQAQDYCHSGVFYFDIVLAVLHAETPALLVWFLVWLLLMLQRKAKKRIKVVVIFV